MCVVHFKLYALADAVEVKCVQEPLVQEWVSYSEENGASVVTGWTASEGPLANRAIKRYKAS